MPALKASVAGLPSSDADQIPEPVPPPPYVPAPPFPPLATLVTTELRAKLPLLPINRNTPPPSASPPACSVAGGGLVPPVPAFPPIARFSEIPLPLLVNMPPKAT